MRSTDTDRQGRLTNSTGVEEERTIEFSTMLAFTTFDSFAPSPFFRFENIRVKILYYAKLIVTLKFEFYPILNEKRRETAANNSYLRALMRRKKKPISSPDGN